MNRLREVLFGFGGGVAVVLFAVGWVSLRWVERGPAQASPPVDPWRQPSLVGSPDPWLA